MEQVQNCKLSQLELVETQIKAVQAQLRETKKDEEKLVGILTSEKPTLDTLEWLNGKVTGLRKQKEEQEGKLRQLEREREYLQSTKVELKKVRTTMGRIFATLEQAPPAKKRELLREIFQEVRVFRDNKVRVLWSLPATGVPAVTSGEGGYSGLSSLQNGGAKWTTSEPGANPK